MPVCAEQNGSLPIECLGVVRCGDVRSMFEARRARFRAFFVKYELVRGCAAS